MVSAYLVDILSKPTAALQELYEESGATTENFPGLVSEHYSRVFRKPEALHEVSVLDVDNTPETFPDGALVRFRAMVQDTSPSSEMYLSKSKTGKCGGWSIEFAEEDLHVDYADLRECSVLWAVSVPGESQWCSQELDGPRLQQERAFSAGSKPPYKPQQGHKYPHPTVPHVGVQVKLYDTDGSERLKTTEVVTFVGILTSESLSSDLETAIEVPTLHVLFMQQHPLTLLSRSYPCAVAPEHAAADPQTSREMNCSRIELTRVREQLISWLAEEALGRDREVAEWVLLACIARVQSRNPPLLPPSLTISHFPSSPPVPSTSTTSSVPVPALSTVLEKLLPLTHTLSLSLDALNNDSYVPESKDEDLHSGALQLPRGTVLLVTEGGVREGKLVDRGVLNVHALQEVMSAQTLAYAFPFSQFSFPTDISCIVLSQGSKSALFKTDIVVPLKAERSPASVAALYKPEESIVMPPPERLASFRDLVVGARSGKVQVSEETSAYIQRDFVRERQQDQSITSEDLIRRMTVARLYALSLHETNLTVDVWERAKAFDERRRAALTNAPGEV